MSESGIPRPNSSSYRMGLKTALLIEDDHACRQALAKLLQLDGWEILEAEDGDIGIRIALESKPELIICDLLMPRCNGFQVCRTVQDKLPNSTIVVTSANDYPIDRMNAIEAGADYYIAKPITRDALRTLLSEEGLLASGKRGSTEEEPVYGLYFRFWGVRGSIPTPGPSTVYYGGNTSCVEVRAGHETIILDAGTGIRPLGLSLAKEFEASPLAVTVLITHTHWDHIQGFPFFSLAYDPKNKIKILGYEGARESLASVLSGQMESPYFPVSLKQMPGHVTIEELKNLEFDIGPVQVNAKFLNHPGICAGYRLTCDAGSLAYLPDNEPFQRLRDQPSTDGNARVDVAAFARSQDTKLVEFLRGVDTLIIDSQYDASEYADHIGWGHGCVDDVTNLAMEAGVGHLFLFHHDPTHDDRKIDEMVKKAREIVSACGSSMEVNAAREGEAFVLRAKKTKNVSDKLRPC